MANYLTAMHGTIPGVDDTFTHTLALTSPAGAGTVAESLRDNWAALWTETPYVISSLVSAQARYTHVTVAEILDLTGPLTPLSAATRRDFATELVGTGSAKHPSQVSWAVSLTAGAYPNGTPVRGRFYMPVPGVPVGVDGLIPTSTTALLADAMQVWLSRLTSEGHIPAVWSRGAPDSGAAAGFMGTVASVRVGGKLDTIRSRRNATPEIYVTRAVPAPA